MSDLLFKHYAHGKLLLSGEYFVLDGAKALAIPTQYGQYFKVYENSGNSVNDISWKSYDHKKNIWLAAELELKDNNFLLKSSNDDFTARRLEQLLNIAFKLSDYNFKHPLRFETNLEFNKDWGLGSSSTLVVSLSKWLNIDPYELLSKTFRGSGYDIACATSIQPIFYKRDNGATMVTPLTLNFPFKDNIYFVYLGRKQNSNDAISHYQDLSFDDKHELIAMISGISETMAQATTIQSFMHYIDNHELLIANNVHLDRAKDLYFSDFKGSVKSLGAWGGDFIMAVATDTNYLEQYFEKKGFDTVIPYRDMVYTV